MGNRELFIQEEENSEFKAVVHQKYCKYRHSLCVLPSFPTLSIWDCQHQMKLMQDIPPVMSVCLCEKERYLYVCVYAHQPKAVYPHLHIATILSQKALSHLSIHVHILAFSFLSRRVLKTTCLKKWSSIKKGKERGLQKLEMRGRITWQGKNKPVEALEK